MYRNTRIKKIKCMRLIGLKLNRKIPAVTKLLEEGWYPFGDYPAPVKDYGVRHIEADEMEQQIYRYAGLPKISVNCIVGKNGAGKSTLLDVVYRIINNFACTVLGREHIDNQHGRALEYARGVHAELFYETDNRQCCIECADEVVMFYQEDTNTHILNSVAIQNLDDPKAILREFFYTISTNYSIYSFNEDDYSVSDAEKVFNGISGSWIKGLFHKNDGYLTPIVITPFRNKGSIDVEKENGLSRQRIVALSILSKAQDLSFIDGYDPVELSYDLNLDYQDDIKDNYVASMNRLYKGIDCGKLIQAFCDAWQDKLLSEKKVTLNEKYKDQYEVALFYLGYKTFKICMTYEDFWNAFDVDYMLDRYVKSKIDDREEQEKFFSEYLAYDVPEKIKAVLDKIQEETEKKDGSHITLKIEVCLKYLKNILEKNELEWADSGIADVAELVKGKQLETYNDAVRQLPPPFFNYDIKFVPNGTQRIPDSSWGGIGSMDGFTIAQMSSGERQMLNMVSYVLYHIKNIQSINDDDYRVRYRHICLIFDEAELYFHPDYQRKFLDMLLESLQWCHIDTKIIRSIQILIVTHSPFVLSDMLRKNMMYLEKGERKDLPKNEIFGANLYQLMTESFFFTEGALGKVASKQITEWIKVVNEGGTISESDKSLIGDAIIRNYLTRKMAENRGEYV